jgi:hypothetical protein
VRPWYRALLAEQALLLWLDTTFGLPRFLPPRPSFLAPIQNESVDRQSAGAFLSPDCFWETPGLSASFSEMNQILNDFCIICNDVQMIVLKIKYFEE